VLTLIKNQVLNFDLVPSSLHDFLFKFRVVHFGLLTVLLTFEWLGRLGIVKLEVIVLCLNLKAVEEGFLFQFEKTRRIVVAAFCLKKVGAVALSDYFDLLYEVLLLYEGTV
jgi:hypothetical protein